MIETKNKENANFIIREDGVFSVLNPITDNDLVKYYIEGVLTDSALISIKRIELAIGK